MSIAEALDSFISEIQDIKRYSPNTVRAYKDDLEFFFQFCITNSKSELSAITDRTIKHYLMTLNEAGLERKSISRKLASIRGFFKYASHMDYIQKNPSEGIHNPKLKRKLPEVASEKNITDALLELEKESTGRASKLRKVIFELLYGCALRVSELCNLNAEDINMGADTIRIRGKGNKVRIVPLGRKSKEILLDYMKAADINYEGALLINENGRRIYPRMVHRIINLYLGKTSDLKKKSPHVLRHSAATHMLDNDADLMAVKEILGHENLSTTQIYTHVSVERLKSAYKKAHPKS